VGLQLFCLESEGSSVQDVGLDVRVCEIYQIVS
jgi:hypothetical protein